VWRSRSYHGVQHASCQSSLESISCADMWECSSVETIRVCFDDCLIIRGSVERVVDGLFQLVLGGEREGLRLVQSPIDVVSFTGSSMVVGVLLKYVPKTTLSVR